MIGRTLALLALLVTSAAAPAQSQELAPEDLEHFESKIRPVLVERCYQCHGADPERIRAGLALVDAEGLRAGGDSGAVIVPGAPDDSLLVEAEALARIAMTPDAKPG